MAVVIALPLARPSRHRRHLVLWLRAGCRSWGLVRVNDDQRSSRFLRLATTGAVAYCAVFPLLQVALVAESWDGGYVQAAWALAATACYLPLHLRHARWAVRGTRPPLGGWTLAAMAVVIVGVTPLAGIVWLASFHALVVSALFVLRPPWSLLAVAVVVALTLLFALTLDTLLVDAASYYPITVVWRASAVFVPVWLVGAIGQLQTARQALAEEAVVRERLRIDDELRRTLGVALEAIAARARTAGALVSGNPAAGDGGRAANGTVVGAAAEAEDELRALVDGSRRTLAEARQMIGGYREPSLQAELDVAATLLTAAGIETRIVFPSGGPAEALADAGSLRVALHSATAGLLRDPGVRACVIIVTREDDGVRLEVHRADPLADVAEVAVS